MAQMGVLAERHAFRSVKRDSFAQLSDALGCSLGLHCVVRNALTGSWRPERSQNLIEHFFDGLELAGRELGLNDALVFGVRVMVIALSLFTVPARDRRVKMACDKGR
jgi:hypothetical protein